ncbi:MAG TPA: hypothetical protein VJU77_10745 [Chthoniobacterales bacterium]|nr:hypothetical protein [Chthoniobacterales bacterium]
MSFAKDGLYKLLPTIHRIRDAEQSDMPLEALLGVVSEQAAVLEESLAQLYDDQFIETCAGWVAPYIGDLIGYRPLHGGVPQISSPRSEVADTIGFRRRKGTSNQLEQLARDVTGWPARAVEFFQLLGWTQFMNHIRPRNFYAPDLRQWEPLERLGTAFESTAHTIDVRRIATQKGRYNIPNVGIFLWRLRAFPLTASPAVPAVPGDKSRFFFSPLGNNTPLFTHPDSEEEITHLAEPINVPEAISRRVLNAYLESRYGAGKSILISGVATMDVEACNLSDISGGLWAHTPKSGKVAVDPVLGRIAFSVPPLQPPVVTFHYGFSAEMGGGEYSRAASFDSEPTQITTVKTTATIPASITTAGVGDVLEINDSGRYEGPPLTIHCDHDKRIEIRAADKSRPTIVQLGQLNITGDPDSEVTLNGLLLIGATLRVVGTSNQLKKLRLRHCTFVPGLRLNPDGNPISPNRPSLVVTTPNLSVEIDHCIMGGLRVSDMANVSIRNSIIDATRPDRIAYAGNGRPPGRGGPLRIENSTVIGKVHTFAMDYASNTIFLARRAAGDPPSTAPIRSEKKQAGCVRFCFIPEGAVLPRRYRCQPDLALAQRATALGLAGAGDLPFSIQKSIRDQIVPLFTSLRYGHPGYGQLQRQGALEIREGADDEAEMGAFHDLFQPQRETNLRVRLDEYLRFGLEAGVFYST